MRKFFARLGRAIGALAASPVVALLPKKWQVPVAVAGAVVDAVTPDAPGPEAAPPDAGAAP